jgi:hypothetical protein
MVLDFLLQGFALIFIVFMAFVFLLVVVIVFCTIFAFLDEITGLLCGWGHRLWLKSKREAEQHFAEMDKITV